MLIHPINASSSNMPNQSCSTNPTHPINPSSSETYCDGDLTHEDTLAEGQGLGDNLPYGENDSDQDPRVARIAVQQQMRLVENNVDRITRELDLLNTDLEGMIVSIYPMDISINTSFVYSFEIKYR